MHPRESDLVLQGNRDGLQTSEDQAVSERVQKVSGVIEEDIKTEFVVGMILVSNVIGWDLCLDFFASLAKGQIRS